MPAEIPPSPDPEPELTLEQLLEAYPDLADAPLDQLELVRDQVWRERLGEARARADAGADRPAGRALSGLADLADQVRLNPQHRQGLIERLEIAVVAVEDEIVKLRLACDGVAEDADDWLEMDPERAEDDFMRMARADKRQAIGESLRTRCAEVAEIADQLRGLL